MDVDNTNVFFTCKNKQMHTIGCVRLERKVTELGMKAEEMTWVEALRRGHLVCSRCQADKTQCDVCEIAKELCECEKK